MRVGRSARLTGALAAGAWLWWAAPCSAAVTLGVPGLSLSVGGANASGTAGAIQIILLLTVLSFAPAILITMTAFTRIIVVLSFVRSALSLQQSPPNQVLIGLSLFLTLFVMSPTLSAVNSAALQPYLAGRISQSTAITQAELPFKQFMARQTRVSDVELFLAYRHERMPRSLTQLPMTTLVPAFAVSELKTAFEIGFMIYLPFLVIDLVVSTTLMSMGMLFLPPTLISLPLKLLLFVMVDGWDLIVKSLLAGFH